MKYQIPLILSILFFLACENPKPVEINPNLESIIMDLGTRLECEDVSIQSLGQRNSFHIIFKNSQYSEDIKERPNYYQENSIDIILRGLDNKEDLPDSLVIEFSEGLLENDVGQKRDFVWRYGFTRLSLEFDIRHTETQLLAVAGNQLIEDKAYEKLDSLCSSFIAMKKELPLAHQLKAIASLNQGDTVQGVEEFRKVLIYDSLSIETHVFLCYLFLNTGNEINVAKHAESIYQIDSTDSRSYYYKAKLILTEDKSKACELLKKAQILGSEEAGTELLFSCN